MANCTGRFTNAGRAKVASYIKGTDQRPEIYVAWGSGVETIANTDTSLGSEVARKLGTVTRTDADTYTVTASFEVESAGTFSEMGLFDALVGGTMLYRGGYSTDSPVGVYDVESVDVSVGDPLNLTIEVDLKSTNVSVTTAGKTKVLDILCAKTS